MHGSIDQSIAAKTAGCVGAFVIADDVVVAGIKNCSSQRDEVEGGAEGTAPLLSSHKAIVARLLHMYIRPAWQLVSCYPSKRSFERPITTITVWRSPFLGVHMNLPPSVEDV